MRIKFYTSKKLTWQIVLSFLAGAMIGEIMPDVTDVIHFYWSDWIASLSGWSKALLLIFDWYFLTFSFYAILFVVAWFMSKGRIGSPVDFRNIFILLTIISMGVTISIIFKFIVGLDFLLVIGIAILAYLIMFMVFQHIWGIKIKVR